MKKGKILTLALGGVVALTSTVLAMTYNTFTATERPDFNIVMDGELQKLKDGNGNDIHPVIINGSTYLPLKATASLFGKSVSWDSATGTATIGDKVLVNRSLFDVSKIALSDSDASAVKGEQNLTFSDIGDMGVSYKEGIKISSEYSRFGLILNENYEKLNITLLPINKGNATFSTQENRAVTFKIIDNETGIELLNKTVDNKKVCEMLDLDIKNVKKLKFEVDGLATEGEAYFLNPTVK